jgi:hypothetical protein
MTKKAGGPVSGSDNEPRGELDEPDTSSSVKERLSSIERKLKKLRGERDSYEQRYFLSLAVAISCLIVGVGLILGQIVGEPLLSNPAYRMASLLCFAGGGVLISFVPIWKVRLRVRDGQIIDLEFEEEILEYSPSKEETRADKLLRMNQAQLRRYHEMNLQQTMWIFFIGIGCLVVGVVIIGVTMYLVRTAGTEAHEKIIIAVVGAVGGILANFIAAIYLQMHSATAKSLNQFHSTLVATQQLFLANLMASRIEPDTKRWDALAKISMSMIGWKESAPAETESKSD